jgi:hypothetical protein
MPRYYNNGSTTGTIISTVQDMAKFIKMILAGGMGERGRVLKAETLEMMLTPQNGGIPLDFDNRIGFIWFLNDAELSYAGNICYHNGANPGFRSHLEILRDHKLGVVVLANDEQVAFEDIARQALKLALQDKTGLTPPPPTVPAYSPPVTWDQDRLNALQGIYVLNEVSGTPFLTVKSLPGALEWTLPKDGSIYHVVPKANGWLSTPGSQATEWEFSEISSRKVMIAHMAGQQIQLAEYYSPPAIPATWTARLGTYQATNWLNITSLPPTANLIVANGMLGFGPYVLVPVSDTLAYVRGLGRAGGSSVQVLSIPPDGHEEIQLLGVQFKKQ